MQRTLVQKISLINQVVLDTQATLSETALVKRFVDAAVSVLDADYGYFFRWDQNLKRFELFYQDRNTPFVSKVPRKTGITARTLRSRKPYYVARADRETLVRKDAKKFMQGVVIIPVAYKENSFGTLDICFYSRHRFSEEDKILSEYIGTGIARSLTIHRLVSSLRDFKDRLDKTLDSVFIFDPTHFKLEYANDGAVQLLGYSRRELLHRTLVDVQTKYDLHAFRNLVTPLFLGASDSLMVETVLKTKSNQLIPVALSVQLTKSQDGSKKFLSIVHDLTERKRVEKESAKLLRQKNDFLSVASHELKTPITTIKGFSQLLSAHLKNSDPTAQLYLAKITDHVTKVGHLINDLLDISRIESGKLKFHVTSFELSALLRQTINDLQLIVKPHPLILQTKIRYRLNGDPERVVQALNNLIINAAKYSPPKSSIIVQLSREGSAPKISIEDFGKGISSKDRERIFRPFFQAETISSGAFPGLGLGLFITSKIIDQHGGTLTYTKKRTKGSIFSFTLSSLREKRKK